MPTDPAPFSAAIPIASSIAPLAGASEAWLVDIWGVMHDGVSPYPEAVSACQRFREAGGIVLLLSNSPRPGAGVMAQLDQIGVAREAYDGVVSSGDATRHLIAALGEAAVMHLGPERDRPLFEGLAARLTAAEEAEAVVCSGLYDDTSETPEDYADVLAELRARGLEMICANPDLKVERGGRIIYCAGAIAEAYARIGGKVAYAGKPHLPIYEMAFEALARLGGRPVSRGAALAIGDGAKTDIAGAVAAGVPSVYIASAVHLGPGSRLDAAALDGLFPDPAVRPVAAMTGLRW